MDKISPYIEQGNVLLVPIIQARLSFTIVVRQAFEAAQLGEADVVAVALTDMIRRKVLEAIKSLPTVSVVHLCQEDTEQIEVCPVTACDGYIEAIQLATAEDIAIEFIDKPIAPGNFINRHCLPDPSWPDDGFAIAQGANAYLNMVEKRVSRPPWRYDPVDAWREKYMAFQLQKLSTQYRKILFVCTLPHINPIKRMLSDPKTGLDDHEEVFSGKEDRIYCTKAAPTTALLYLDDFPKLTQRYNECRRDKDRALSFDKQTAIYQELANKQFTGINAIPLRRYDAFTEMLSRLIHTKRQFSPKFEDVNNVADSCLGSVIAKKFKLHLIDNDNVKENDHIDKQPADDENGSDQQNFKGKSSEKYTARFCNPFSNDDWIVYRKGPAPEDVKWMMWKDYSDHHNCMRQQAVNQALRSEIQCLSMKFTGSMENGIDIRRTLTSYYQGERSLYVKRRKSRRYPVEIDQTEPIVWIFKPSGSITENSTCVRPRIRNKQGWTYFLSEKFNRSDKEHDAFIRLEQISGAVSFAETGKDLSEDLMQRLPDSNIYFHKDGVDCWWDELFHAALQYANASVLCVIPDEMPEPTEFIEKARESKKEVFLMRLSKFDSFDVMKLSFQCHVSYRREETDDKLQPYTDKLVKKYRKMVESEWPIMTHLNSNIEK